MKRSEAIFGALRIPLDALAVLAALALSYRLRSCLEFSRIGFINTLAFRLRYYTGIVTYLIYVTVYYFIWKALYATDPKPDFMELGPEAVSARRAWTSINGPRMTPRITGAIGKS